MKRTIVTAFAICLTFALSASILQGRDLFKMDRKAKTRWSSFENLNGVKGQGAKANKGGKGHPFERLNAGQSITLLDIQESGIINRMWFTIDDRKPEMLRSLRLEMFWDNAKTPAVSVPFGDFFGAINGKAVKFESELFSNAEGRSFNCFIPMPFRKAAKIVITNDSKKDLRYLFFDINYLIDVKHDKDVLYFHSHWRRENPTTLGKEFEILPKIKGSGRFLGTNVGVVVDKKFRGWWGEGEVKMYLDGDKEFPTIAGTGTEDYIGTAWNLGLYANRYQGCLLADRKNGSFGFYRYHVIDPVYFHDEIRVTIQAIGGAKSQSVIEMMESGVECIPTSIDEWGHGFHRLLDMEPPKKPGDPNIPSGYAAYMRTDDYSAVSLFYLDRAENGLPPMQPVEKRTEVVKEFVEPKKK